MHASASEPASCRGAARRFLSGLAAPLCLSTRLLRSDVNFVDNRDGGPEGLAMIARLMSLLLSFVAAAMIPPAALAQEVLRTPDARFATLPDYRFAPRYVDVPWGELLVRMHFVDEGPRDGPVVLMLHGQPSWSFIYRKLISGMAARGFRVIAPDLIGYGRSDKPARMEDYSYARHIGAVEALIGQLKLRDATLVVHDWGGLIGLPIAARQPERFTRLALFNTSLNDGSDIESPQFKAGFDRWIELLRTVPLVEADKVIAAQVARQPPPDVLAAYMAPHPDGSYQSGLRRMSALIPRTPADLQAKENGEARAALRTWTKPVMIAFSEDSDRIHPGQFRLFSELFPKDAIWYARRIPGTRHFLFEDRPDVVLALLAAFAKGEAQPPKEPRAVVSPSSAPAMLRGPALQSDVATYVAFGDQRTGSPASLRSLDWMDQQLRSAGYRTRREALPVAYSNIARAELRIGDRRIDDGLPMWPVSFTAKQGVHGRLVRADEAGPGDIAMVRLPFSPYASLFDPAYRPIFADILRRRPAGLVAVTEHASGEVVALNVRDASDRGAAQRMPLPALLLGQKHQATLDAALGKTVQLTVQGTTTNAADANLIAEAGPDNGSLLVLSTPRNGWFAAGGERGPGIAMILGLARWLREAHPHVRVRLIVSSHHELGGLGMKAVLDRLDPIEPIALWLHLGANIATREAEARGAGLVWTDAANARRGVGVSPPLLPLAKQAFAPVAGLAVEPLDEARAVGEAALIARAGSFSVAGLVGYQLLHHTRLDTADATAPSILEATANAVSGFLTRVIELQKAPQR
jgi:haloalkane dehalogenase